MNTRVSIGKCKLKNPVLVASGTFGYAQEFKDLVKLDKLGAIVTKTITLKPCQGNPPPRIFESASGMLNAIGLQNEGLENFIKEKLTFLNKLDTRVIVSIAGQRAEEYEELAERLSEKGVSAFELNLSCPNIKGARVKGQGLRLISQGTKATYETVTAVRKATRGTIITKLTPNVTDIVSIARAAQDAGSDAVSLINTFLAMGIDINSRRPVLGNITGGLSGPAIKPIALCMVWQVARAVKIPVIGIGGIMNAKDALEFIIAGASAIQVGTANLIEPKTGVNIVAGIKDYMRKNKIKDIKQLIGSLKIGGLRDKR